MSKFVIVVIFLIAVTMLGSPLEFDLAALGELLAGIALLLIAGFAPYVVYKLIRFMGFDIYQMMSMEQESKHALDRPLPLPSLNPGSPARTLDGARDSGTTPPPSGPSTETAAAPPGEVSESATSAAPAATEAAAPSAGTTTATAGTASTGTAATVAGGAMTGGALIAAEGAKEAVEASWNAGPQAGALVSGAADQASGPATSPPPPPPSAPTTKET